MRKEPREIQDLPNCQPGDAPRGRTGCSWGQISIQGRWAGKAGDKNCPVEGGGNGGETKIGETAGTRGTEGTRPDANPMKDLRLDKIRRNLVGQKRE